MSETSLLKQLTQQEDLNFLLTNRIPRRYATLFMGWFSRIENPLVCALTLAIWKRFAEELNLEEAKKNKFKSLHDCFIRELKQDARTINQDPKILASPCDAIVGAFGKINGTDLIQAKGFPYKLMDLLADRELVERYRNGWYITLRLKSTMYHRFHAPYDGRVASLTYISGDTWNVNPIALKRIERLYCKNERVVLDITLSNNRSITLVPVAAILVASIHLNFLDQTLDLKYKGPNRINCEVSFKKGDELGYFQHGSTIIVFTTNEYQPCQNIAEGTNIRMGQALFENS